MLLAIASPSSAVASSLAFTASVFASPHAARTAPIMSVRGEIEVRVGRELGGRRTCVFTIAVVRAESFGRFSNPVITTTSQPIARSAPPVPMRVAWSSAGVLAMRTWLATAPFFCARPVTSSSRAPCPSRCAAIARIAPTVTTPVPPMPVTSTLQGTSSEGSTGSGSAAKSAPSSSPARLRLRLAQRPAGHGDEARAVAFDAREVLVAARLVDAALAAELGLDRLDRDAVALHRAIAAALADQLVDHDAAIGVGELAALAQAPRLGRAGLVVDERRYAGRLAQLLLHAVELVAVVQRDAVRKHALRELRRCRP